MEKQNITLSIRKDILKRFKILAVQQGESISGLMTKMIEEAVAGEEAYEAAKRRHFETLENGVHLGTDGRTRWTREDLHERQ